MTRMILALALHQGHIQDLAGAGSGCCPRLPNQLSMRQSCQEPDCAEKWDGITQCDSQARFHRSQVLGETIKNKQWERDCCGSVEQEWVASWSPRSHGSSPPLGQSPVRGAVSRSDWQRRVYLENFQGWSLPDSPASAENWKLAGIKDNKALNNDIFMVHPQRSTMPTLL